MSTKDDVVKTDLGQVVTQFIIFFAISMGGILLLFLWFAKSPQTFDKYAMPVITILFSWMY